MKKLEILIRNAKNHFNQIKLLRLLRLLVWCLLPLSFLRVARKIGCDKFNNILAFFFNVNQTHIV